MILISYFVLTVSVLIFLSWLLLRSGVGGLQNRAPDVPHWAKSVPVVVGFAVKQAGLIAIGGAFLALWPADFTLWALIGLTLLALGIGFHMAIDNLGETEKRPPQNKEDPKRALKLSNL